MLTSVYVEILKLQRSKIIWVMLAAPLIVAALFFLIQISSEDYPPFWPFHLFLGFAAWAYFMLPMTATVITTMLAQMEHSPKTWAHLFTLPVGKWRHFMAKSIVSLLILGAMTLLMVGFMIAGGWLGGQVTGKELGDPQALMNMMRPQIEAQAAQGDGGPQFGEGLDNILKSGDWRIFLAERLGLMFLAAFLMIAIQLWAALIFRNFLIPLAIGVGGGFVAVVAQASEYGIYFPWLLPINMLNLDADKMNFALSLGFGGGLVAFLLMLIHMSRMEIK